MNIVKDINGRFIVDRIISMGITLDDTPNLEGYHACREYSNQKSSKNHNGFKVEFNSVDDDESMIIDPLMNPFLEYIKKAVSPNTANIDSIWGVDGKLSGDGKSYSMEMRTSDGHVESIGLYRDFDKNPSIPEIFKSMQTHGVTVIGFSITRDVLNNRKIVLDCDATDAVFNTIRRSQYVRTNVRLWTWGRPIQKFSDPPKSKRKMTGLEKLQAAALIIGMVGVGASVGYLALDVAKTAPWKKTKSPDVAAK